MFEKMNCKSIHEEMRPPVYFYKYRSFDKKTKDNLSEGTIYFSALKQLNDPDEFAFNKDYDSKNIERFKLFNENNYQNNRINKNRKDFYNSEIEKARTIDRKIKSNNLIESGFKSVYSLMESCFRLFCCAENKSIRTNKIDENFYMWQKYADKNKGICIEYERNQCFAGVEIRDSMQYHNIKNGTNPMLSKVNYEETDPYLLNQYGEMNINEGILFRKYKKWEYENEWRFLYSTNASEVIDKEKGMNINILNCFSRISSIIFGSEMVADERKKVMNIFTDKPNPPKFKEAIFDDLNNNFQIKDYLI